MKLLATMADTILDRLVSGRDGVATAGQCEYESLCGSCTPGSTSCSIGWSKTCRITYTNCHTVYKAVCCYY